MEPVKYTELRNDTEGAYGGVGIVIGLRETILTVISPMEDSPAFKAGILAGDKIVKIDGKTAEKFSNQDAMKKLRGEAGTEVTLTISRPTFPEPKDFKLTRANIKVETVKDVNNRREFPIGENKVGYVRLTQFGEQTTSELQDALKKLEQPGYAAG